MKNEKNAHSKSNQPSKEDGKKGNSSKDSAGNNSHQQGNASKSNSGKLEKAGQDSKQNKK